MHHIDVTFQHRLLQLEYCQHFSTAEFELWWSVRSSAFRCRRQCWKATKQNVMHVSLRWLRQATSLLSAHHIW